MKSSTKTLLIIGALGAAAVYAASKSEAFGGSGQEGAGSLGGEDDSITTDSNPFARIDPNYQYPGPSNNYFIVQPDGSVTPTTPDAQIIIDGSGETGTGPISPEGYKPSWYDNPWLYGGALVGGGIVVSEGYDYLKGKIKTPKAEELAAKSEIKGSSEIKEKTPMEKIREKLGFKSADPNAEIVRAQTMTDATIKDPIALKEEFVAPKEVALKTKFSTGTKIAEGAGAVLLVAQLGSSVTERWKEYKPSNVKEAAGVIAAGATDFASGLFSFGSGLVYRPKTNKGEYQGQNTGWFASFQDLYDLGAKHREEDTPFGTRIAELLGVQGYFSKPKSDDSGRVVSNMQTQIDVRSALANQIPITQLDNARPKITQVQLTDLKGGSKSVPLTKVENGVTKTLDLKDSNAKTQIYRSAENQARMDQAAQLAAQWNAANPSSSSNKSSSSSSKSTKNKQVSKSTKNKQVLHHRPKVIIN